MTEQFDADFSDVFKKMDLLSVKLNLSVMGKALRKAARPTLNKMKSLAPKGTKGHRTYKGRLVGPGFASRNIKMRTRSNKAGGFTAVEFGTTKEAFYIINFYDQGPTTISSRRVPTGGTIGRRGGRRQLKRIPIKPYTLKCRPWFESTFKSDRQRLENDFAAAMRIEIDKVAKG